MLAKTDIDAARLELQLELEELYDKNQTLTRIRKEFLSADIDFVSFMKEWSILPELGLDLLVQMVLHKRTTISTMVGLLRKHYEPLHNASQLTANAIEHCVEAELVRWDQVTKKLILEFNISPDVQEEIDRYQFPLPMVIPPMEVTNNRETGYVTQRGSIILKNNHHTDDVCLDHINRMNAIAFAIDETTSTMVQNKWRNLDHAKDGETHEEYKKRVRAFDKYDRTSRTVINKVLSLGNRFYLTHRYDKRGRVYCQGYHTTYQGNDWNKAVIELCDKEYIE
jgi:hypothetical protein